MDPFELVLSRMDGVQRHGDDSARAFSPLSGRKTSRSVSISRGANGTVLIYDFAGASPHEILAAVGLELRDLFVQRDLRSMTAAEKSQMRQAALIPRWKAAVAVLGQEANVILFAGNQLADNRPLNDADLTRVRVACLRVFDAQEVLRAR